MADDLYDVAYRAACAYCRDVESGVLDALEEAVKDGEVTDLDGLEDRLNETVDGCEAVIYTGRSLCYLFASSNDSAAEENLGEDTKLNTAQRCYWAICADVRESSRWDDLVEKLENPEEEEEEAAIPCRKCGSLTVPHDRTEHNGILHFVCDTCGERWRVLPDTGDSEEEE